MYLGDFKQLKNLLLLVGKEGEKKKIRIEISALETHYPDTSGQEMALQNPTYIPWIEGLFFLFLIIGDCQRIHLEDIVNLMVINKGKRIRKEKGRGKGKTCCISKR